MLLQPCIIMTLGDGTAGTAALDNFHSCSSREAYDVFFTSFSHCPAMDRAETLAATRRRASPNLSREVQRLRRGYSPRRAPRPPVRIRVCRVDQQEWRTRSAPLTSIA